MRKPGRGQILENRLVGPREVLGGGDRRVPAKGRGRTAPCRGRSGASWIWATPLTPARARGSSVRATPSLRPPRILKTSLFLQKGGPRKEPSQRTATALFYLIPCGDFQLSPREFYLSLITLDTDTTVHTLYGRQMGGRKSYNPKNKGKRSYQPILTFLAETREYLMGGLRGGDRPTGQQIAAHLESAFRALPGGVKRILARADAGFYCWEAVAAYQQAHCQFVIVARKTRRLVEQLQQAAWKPSPHSDAEAQCEFLYQPQGWAKACRFLALRYEKEPEAGAAEQYQLFATSAYTSGGTPAERVSATAIIIRKRACLSG